jgi:hypothetical protein
MRLDYLAIGHVTEDVWRDGRRTPGGTVLYSARASRAFVDKVGVLTAAAPSFDAAQTFPQIEVRCIDAPCTTQFENYYTPAGRTQHVVACPVKLTLEHLRHSERYSDWLRSRIIHLAPVCNEVSAAIATHASPESFIAVTPQGWMRRWDETGRVFATTWDSAPVVLARANAVVLSIADVSGNWELIRTWASQTELLVVTQGPRGCTAFIGGEPHPVPAPKVEEVDPTGAGDIFAAALFIELQRGADPLRACAFANCIAAQSVTRRQLEGLPNSDDIDRCSKIKLEIGD